ncbi:hypothetical protein D3C87_2066740 [compost metagenome]
MMPIINSSERIKPKLAPEVVSNILLGPGVIAATHRKPNIERNKLGSMRWVLLTQGDFLQYYCQFRIVKLTAHY